MTVKLVRQMTDKELKRLIRRSSDDDLVQQADEELAARKEWREQQDDTPCIEWNGFNRPGDY